MTDAALPTRGRRGRDATFDGSEYWWVFLLTGSAWMLVSIVVLRFDYTSARSVSILFGCMMLGATGVEALAAAASRRWWRIGHAVLALTCLIVGITAFMQPGGTFKALAAIMSFYLVIKGTMTVILSLASREVDLWWLSLLTGVVEVALGFWAAGYWGRGAVLVLVWIGISALMRGIGEVALAFRLRRFENAV